MRSLWRVGVALIGMLYVLPVSVRAQPVTVEVQDVVQEALATRLETVGDLNAAESVRITSVSSKLVERLLFDDGDRVKKGQILVEMASAQERALLEESRANLIEAERQLTRMRNLHAKKSISEADLDTQERLVKSLGAKVDALVADVNELTIRAPFAGQLGLREVSPGAYLTPGTMITTLVDDSTMKLDFSVPSIYLPHLSLGMSVTAKVRALGDLAVVGKIKSINNEVDVATRSVRIRAIVDNAKYILKQGMLTSVVIEAGTRDALVIAESALVPMGGDNFVFLVQEMDGVTRVQRRAIKIGERSPGKVEVLEGLQEHDRVVTRGLQRIRDGQEVSIKSSAERVVQ